MAIDFPANPSSGDRFENYIYDAESETWRRIRPYNAPKASGGNVVKDAGGYRYHAFTSSGTFTVYKAGLFELLAVGGGGGGGTDDTTGQASGGGGAGGPTSGVRVATRGSDTEILTGLVAVGGGPGVGRDGPQTESNLTDWVGGSGGGGESDGTGPGLNGIPGQGNPGGAGDSGNGGGGGGGAGIAGFPSTGNNIGGTGGAGTADFLEWAYVTGTGVSGLYAGGGGGGGDNVGGFEGAGGGGRGQANLIANTGKGGSSNSGGGGGGEENQPGGDGGSGVAIFRYVVGETSPIPAVHGYLGSYEDTSDATSYTFSNVYIPRPGLIALALSNDANAAANSTFSAVTVDGTSASLAKQDGQTNGARAEIWYANVSSLSSSRINVVANTAQLARRVLLAVYIIENVSSDTPVETNSIANATSSTVPVSLTTSSFTQPTTVIATFVGASDERVSFTGIVEDYDTVTNERNSGHAGGSQRVESGAITIEATPNAATNRTLVYAAWQ